MAKRKHKIPNHGMTGRSHSILGDMTYRRSKTLNVSYVRPEVPPIAALPKERFPDLPPWTRARYKVGSWGRKGLNWARGSGLGNLARGGLIGVGAVTALASVPIGIASAVSSKAHSLRRPPVVHVGRLRNTGQTNQYYNLGVDPFAGVRFAGRKRNFM